MDLVSAQISKKSNYLVFRHGQPSATDKLLTLVASKNLVEVQQVPEVPDALPRSHTAHLRCYCCFLQAVIGYTYLHTYIFHSLR